MAQSLPRLHRVPFFTHILVGLFLLTSTAHAAFDEKRLKAPLSTQSGQLSEGDWTQVFEVLQSSSVTNNLLHDVSTKLGATDFSVLKKIVKLCPELPQPVQGHYRSSKAIYQAVINADGSAELDAQSNRDVQSGYRSEENWHGPYREITVITDVAICLRPGISLGETALVLSHELQHLLGDPFFKNDSMLNYLDADDYVRRNIEAPGGELESYVTQVRAYLALNNKTRYVSADMQQLLPFFDDHGNITRRADLIHHLLDDRGYRKQLTAAYKELVTSQKTTQMQLRSNIPSIRSWATQLANSKQGTERSYYRNYVDRLDQEWARLSAEIRGLEAKELLL